MSKDYTQRVIFKAEDKVTGVINKVNKDMSTTEKVTKKTSRIFDKFFSKKRKIDVNNKSANSKIDKTKEKLEDISNKKIAPRIDAGGEGSSTLDKLMGKAKKLGTIVAGISLTKKAFDVGMDWIKKGSTLEQQELSMEHFIGISNQDKDDAWVKESASNYIKALRDNAKKTPFDTDEVMQSGTRLLNVAGGDTGKGFELVELAENMAALNPQADLEQATEAIANLKVGMTQSMKKFGFNISQDDIKNAGGVDALIEKEIMPFFEGGAEKLSDTGQGLLNTLTGSIGEVTTDIGYNMLEELKPLLSTAIDIVDRLTPTFEKMGVGVAKGINIAVTVIGKIIDKVQEVWDFLKPVRDRIPAIAEKVGEVIQTIISYVEPLVTFIATAVGRIFEVIQVIAPPIVTIISGIWEKIQPIFTAIGGIIEWVGGIISTVTEFIGGEFGDTVVSVFESFGNVVESVWDIVSPILDWLIDKLETVVGFLKDVAGGIGDVASKVGGKVGDVATTVVGGIGDGFDWVADKLSGKRKAFGQRKVTKDDTPILAHEGETLLTKQESNQLEQGTGRFSRKDTPQSVMNTYNNSEVSNVSKGLGGIHIDKLADEIVVRDDGMSIDEVAQQLARQLQIATANYGGAY